MASNNDFKVTGSSVEHGKKKFPEGTIVPFDEAKGLLKEGFPASRLLPMSEAEAKANAAPAPTPAAPAIETEEEADEEEAPAKEPRESLGAKIKKALTPDGRKGKGKK